MSTVNIVQLTKGAKPTSLTDNFLIKREDVYTGFKTLATRNFFISQSSIAAGKEIDVTAIPNEFDVALDATYDASTSVTGSLAMSGAGQSASIKKLLKCKNFTVVTINMNFDTAVSSTTVTVNGNTLTPETTITHARNASGGDNSLSSPAILVTSGSVQVGVNGLSNVAATFTKGTTAEVNSQEVFIFPGKWQIVDYTDNSPNTVVDVNGSTVGTDIYNGPSMQTDDLLFVIGYSVAQRAFTGFSGPVTISGVTVNTAEQFLSRTHGQTTNENSAITRIIPVRSSGVPLINVPLYASGSAVVAPGALAIALRWVSA